MDTCTHLGINQHQYYFETMEQHRAIKKMMLTIRMEEEIPEKYFSSLREKFSQMYAAGYDHGRTDVVGKLQRKPVAQFDKDERLINIFTGGLNSASRLTGFAVNNLNHAILKNRPCKGFLWKYVTDSEIQELKEANRDKYMY